MMMMMTMVMVMMMLMTMMMMTVMKMMITMMVKKRTSTRETDPDETKPVSLANLRQNFRSKLFHPISADQVELSDNRGALVNWLEGVVEVEDPIALLLRLAIS